MAALLVALASVAGPATSAAAAGGTASAAVPVRVDADEVHYAFQRHEVIFTGTPVTLRRDDATLTCRRLVAKNDARGQIAHAVCSGDVKLTTRERVVTCERATYDDAEARVVCEGNAALKDGPSEAHGTRLVYDLRSDEARLEAAIVTLPGSQVDAHRKDLGARKKGAEK